MKEITICLKNMCFLQLYITQLSFAGNDFLHSKNMKNTQEKCIRMS